MFHLASIRHWSNACSAIIGCTMLTTSWALSPEEALKAFEIHPDFTIDLVAAEPMVLDPVDMAFDEQGRAYVLEFAGYPFPDDPGKIVLLEDTTGDGRFDSRKVFAEGFAAAPSLMTYKGGILVASPPEIIFLKDTDGDGVADIKEVIMSGFPADNQQHNINGLIYGLDNWIYVANGGNGGKASWTDSPDDKMPIAWDDFRFDIDRKKFERTGQSSGGFKITYDNYGHWFSTHNMFHIYHTVFPKRFLGTTAGSTLLKISDHVEGGLGRVFTIGAQETRVNHPEQSGYFSASCGITHYDGGAFGDAFNGNVFVSDVVLNVIHRDIIHENGTSLSAARGRERVEFLATTDRAFRPVNMVTGPDGAIYVLDMNRDVIEHPKWIPDELEKDMDLNAGKDKGRIYRITPKAGLPPIKVNYAKADLPTLITALGHSNGWHRKTAQRLLVERKELKAVQSLEMLASGSKNPLARLHALWTLQGLNSLSDAMVIKGLKDSEAGVRENTLLMIDERGARSDAVDAVILSLANDPHPRVRMTAALLIKSIEGEKRFTALKDILEQDLNDQWSRLALTSAIGPDAHKFIHVLIKNSSKEVQAQSYQLFDSLARTVGREKNVEHIRSVLTVLVDADGAKATAQTRMYVLNGLLKGFRDSGTDAASFRNDAAIMKAVDVLNNSESLPVRYHIWQLMRLLEFSIGEIYAEEIMESRAMVIDSQQPPTLRAAHLRQLEFDNEEYRIPLLFSLLDPSIPAQLQGTAIGQLGGIHKVSIGEELVKIWDTLGSRTRATAVNILLYQPRNHNTLLTALENGDLTPGELNLNLGRRRTLLFSKDKDIATRAEKLFTDAGVVTRKEAMDRMKPATTMKGDPAKGAVTFTNVCATCHTLGTEGSNLAPNLTDIFRKSAGTLLHDIVDPNAAIDTEYIAYNVELKDGEFFSGIVIRDDASGVTLRNATEERSFNRNDIAEMFSSGISLMPEEIEVDMDVQTMADLIAFLQVPR